MPATPAVTTADVRAVLDAVPDPEMPQVSIGDLGMVHAVRVHGEPVHGEPVHGEPAGAHAAADDQAVSDDPAGTRVEIELLPTFSGCPATQVIGEEVARAVGGLEGVAEVDVRFTLAATWTPARITARGRERLRAATIAPPVDAPGPEHGGGAAVGCPAAGSRRLVTLPAPPCPICGAADTVVDSPFGPTPCRSSHYCRACRNPFEAIKP